MVIEWASLLRPEHTLEVMLRGTLVYLAIYGLLRLIIKREIGETGPSNILVLVLLADAAQNAMSGGYTSVPDGLVLVGTILGWSLALDAAAFRWPWIARLTKPSALLLVRDGRLLRSNMRRELITEDELWSQLRKHGVARLAEVRAARMEPDGRISVIRADG